MSLTRESDRTSCCSRPNRRSVSGSGRRLRALSNRWNRKSRCASSITVASWPSDWYRLDFTTSKVSAYGTAYQTDELHVCDKRDKWYFCKTI